MKNLDFIQVCKGMMFLMIGAACLMIGATTFIHNPVKADTPNQGNSAGKIMMSESGFVLNGKPIYHILVWDSETGKSKLYNFDGVNKIVTPSYQLPTSPLY